MDKSGEQAGFFVSLLQFSYVIIYSEQATIQMNIIILSIFILRRRNENMSSFQINSILAAFSFSYLL